MITRMKEEGAAVSRWPPQLVIPPHVDRCPARMRWWPRPRFDGWFRICNQGDRTERRL